MIIEIYICDLLPDVQKTVLDALEVNSPEEANLDVFPLFVLSLEKGGRDNE